MALLLASSSPRRQALLRQIGLDFRVLVPEVDETLLPNEAPSRAVSRLAALKAEAVSSLYPKDVVVAADTLGFFQGALLAKPSGFDEAFEMLLALSGAWHEVWTGVCVRQGERSCVRAVCSRVKMRVLDRGLILRYLRLGEYVDKAGAYAIQGMGAAFVEAIEGDFYNVVGLPLAMLAEVLEGFGVALFLDAEV